MYQRVTFSETEIDRFLLPEEKEVAEELTKDLDVQNLPVGLLCVAVKMAHRFCQTVDREKDPLWIKLRECLYCAAKAEDKKKPLRICGADSKGYGVEWVMWTSDAAARAHRAAMILAGRVDGKSDKIIQAVGASKYWYKADRVLWDAYNTATSASCAGGQGILHQNGA